jgi:MFS transporter, DHA1 family, inner membrane transport protein
MHEVASQTPRAALSLAALSLGMFALGTTSLLVLGLAALIAAQFTLPAGAAGGLITAFAVTYAVAAPLLQSALAGRFRHRTLIVTGLALLAAGSMWGALADSFTELLVSRSLSALGGALLGPSSAAAGAALLPAEQRGRALAAVFAGFTLASVAGVPLGTWLGLVLGWRGATACMGVVALVAALAVVATLRDPGTPSAPLKIRTLLQLLTNWRVTGILGTTMLHLAAQFTVYALMGVLLVEQFGLDATALPTALLLFGLGGVAGNVTAGWLSDRIGPGRVVIISLAGLGACFGLICLRLQPWLAAGVLAGCAAFGTLFSAPQQARLTALAPANAHAAVLALNTSASYLGLAVGSAAAGLVQATVGLSGLGGAALVMLTFAAALFVSSREPGTAARLPPSTV